jgi:hypothetical protein
MKDLPTCKEEILRFSTCREEGQHWTMKSCFLSYRSRIVEREGWWRRVVEVEVIEI